MSSRPQPEHVQHPPPLGAFPSQLWDAFLEFLVNGHTGRVTIHMEQGVVRMVETTTFARETKERGVDSRAANR